MRGIEYITTVEPTNKGRGPIALIQNKQSPTTQHYILGLGHIF